MIRPLMGPLMLYREIASRVTNVAGTLPDASRRTIRQSTVWFRPCTNVPTVFVAEAYSRSVPTAVAGWTPNSSTRIGVISEPPPTPVWPTSRPTKNPESMNRGSMAANEFISPHLMIRASLTHRRLRHQCSGRRGLSGVRAVRHSPPGKKERSLLTDAASDANYLPPPRRREFPTTSGPHSARDREPLHASPRPNPSNIPRIRSGSLCSITRRANRTQASIATDRIACFTFGHSRGIHAKRPHSQAPAATE